MIKAKRLPTFIDRTKATDTTPNTVNVTWIVEPVTGNVLYAIKHYHNQNRDARLHVALTAAYMGCEVIIRCNHFWALDYDSAERKLSERIGWLHS